MVNDYLRREKIPWYLIETQRGGKVDEVDSGGCDL